TYCIDCSLSMCSTCRKMHSRVRGTHTHNVISFGDNEATDVISGMGALLKKRETQCPRHDQHSLHFYCVVCKTMVCVSCKIEAHADHKVEPLEKTAGELRKSLMELSATMEKYQKTTRKSLHEGSRYLTKLQEDCARAERHVEEEARRLIGLIISRKDEVLAMLQSKKRSEEETVSRQVDSLNLTDRQMTNAAHYTRDVLSYASDAEVVDITPFLLDRYREIKKKEDIPQNHIRLKVKITKTTPDKHVADTDFGVTLEVSCPDLKRGTIVNTITTDGSITGIATTSDDLIVVTSFCSKKASIYEKTGYDTGSLVCEVKKGLKQPISVAVTSTQHILITELGDGRTNMGVMAFTTNGEALPDHVILPDSPWDLAVTQRGEMVVCHPERHKVGVYSPDGTLRVCIQSASGGQLLTNPRCVAVNSNGNIVVSDFAKHSVLIFDREGNFLRSYGSEGRGHEQLRHPCGVCCDKHGHILIADSNNNRIHVLEAQGEFKGYLLSKSAGLVEPVAVEVDKNGDLIVGEWSGRIHIVRYL
ncbi:hypothetical protein BaRGS_00016273, partial [Batillaria attramentaria]